MGRVAWFVVGVAAALLYAVMYAALSNAQEHEHGANGLPDWYEAACCNQQDCRPVPDSEIEFGTNPQGEAVVRHIPTSLEFTKDRWKVSQDERYHVCYRGNNRFTGFCVYLRSGV